MNDTQRVQLKLDVLSELGRPLRPEARVLDFGCGEGSKVSEFLSRGFDCYGCDVRLRDNEQTRDLAAAGRVRAIENPYRLPFEDNFFDFVFSDQVMEHVQDHEAAFAEIERVLKPGGYGLHVFPSRYTPLEPHVWVPFASWYRPLWWLKLWAAFGIRTRNQEKLDYRTVALRNYQYLQAHTNYVSRAALSALCGKFFESHIFCMKQALKHHPRSKGPLRLLHRLPAVPRIVEGLTTRVILHIKEGTACQS
jgi:SAM-dependent methyltransferase